MKVKELIELLDGVNPEYEIDLDKFTICDSYTTDYTKKTITLEILEKINEILIKDSDFIPSNYTGSSVDIHERDPSKLYKAAIRHS